MDFTLDRSGEVGVLNLDCDLTLENAPRLREVLLVSLENADYVVVNFKNVEAADTCCLQMLCSAHRISIRSRKRLTLTGVSPEVLRVTAGEMNSFCLPNYAMECSKSCLWAWADNKALAAQSAS